MTDRSSVLASIEAKRSSAVTSAQFLSITENAFPIPSNLFIDPEFLETQINPDDIVTAETPAIQIESLLDTLENNFTHIENLEHGWNGYDAPIPNSDSIETAKSFFAHLQRHQFEPNSILASVMGGITIRITNKSRDVFIEFYNNGRILIIQNQKNNIDSEPNIFSISNSIEDFDYAIKQISGFLYLDYSDRMHIQNHSVTEDQHYHEDETLSFRFPKECFISPDSIEFSAIRVPNMSCNRSKYNGKPTDVLCGYYRHSDGSIVSYLDWGVAEFNVADIPNPLLWRSIPFTSIAVHIPKRKNFYHTEIQSFDASNDPINARGIYTEEILAQWRIKLNQNIHVSSPPGKYFPPIE